MGKERVTIQEYGVVEDLDASSWPSGALYAKILEAEGAAGPLSADYWQACARQALLSKYGYIEKPTYIVLEDGTRRLDLSEREIQTINETWLLAASERDQDNDLAEFFSQKGLSNNRKLRWSVMNCAAGCQFKLHAHPNIELVYCAKGALHGIRMKGEPFTKNFDKRGEDDELCGPNLASLDRPWGFETLRRGEWLVNEVGSIHKSFTSTSGQETVLIVMWGGSHADVKTGEEPRAVDVQSALDHMDDKLGSCDCTQWDEIAETFLPKSERSTLK